jgi:hypothetical protein
LSQRLHAKWLRGKYLVEFGGCNDCHTPGYFLGKADTSRYLGGSDVGFEVPDGVYVGPNLTPDKETGLGSWSKINRYALGSDDKTLKLNPDGSLTIYLQKDSPGPAKEANWLPAPAGQYYLLLRAYALGEALLRSRTEPDGLPLPPIDIVQ